MDDPLKGSAFWDEVDAFLTVKRYTWYPQTT